MIRKTLFALAAASLAGGAQAAVTAYCSNSAVCTGGTSFGASFAQLASETFPNGDTYPVPQAKLALLATDSSWTSYYTATAGGIEFNNTGSGMWAQDYANGSANDSVTLWNKLSDLSTTGASFNAIGGDFFTSDDNWKKNGGALTIAVTDNSGTQTFTLSSTSPTSFVGFTSDSVIQKIVLTSIGANSYVTLSNLVGGTTVAAVPEPGSYAMLLAGLGMMGLMLRRRT
jgi:hypothetical protein